MQSSWLQRNRWPTVFRVGMRLLLKDSPGCQAYFLLQAVWSPMYTPNRSWEAVHPEDTYSSPSQLSSDHSSMEQSHRITLSEQRTAMCSSLCGLLLTEDDCRLTLPPYPDTKPQHSASSHQVPALCLWLPSISTQSPAAATYYPLGPDDFT